MGNEEHPRCGPVILIVEDDVIIRMMAATSLADAGFTILEAEDAEAALILLRARAKGIHAIFTDVRMPGEMDGVMLAHRAKRCWPWIGLLITSAYTKYGRDAMPPGSHFLPKPYEPQQVVKHLHALVGG